MVHSPEMYKKNEIFYTFLRCNICYNQPGLLVPGEHGRGQKRYNEEFAKSAHLGRIRKLKKYIITHPDAGLPNIGTQGETCPAICKRRPKDIRVGDTIAGAWYDVKWPLHIATVQDIFEDAQKVGVWARLHWWEAKRWKGTYTPNPPDSLDNCQLTHINGLLPWFLVHWSRPDAELKDRVLTKGNKIHSTTINLARKDIRLINHPARSVLDS